MMYKQQPWYNTDTSVCKAAWYDISNDGTRIFTGGDSAAEYIA